MTIKAFGLANSPTNLADLNDVSINSPVSGQYLRYNSSLTKWQNSFLNSDVYNYLDTSLTGSSGVTLTKTPLTNAIDISLADTTVTPGSYTKANITVDSKGRITGAASGPDGLPISTFKQGPFIFSKGSPSTQRYQIFTSVNDPAHTSADSAAVGNYNTAPGEMEVTFEFYSDNYFTANNSNGGHLAIVLRCDTTLINSAVYGQGMIMGNVSGNPTGAPNSPTTQIETWFNTAGYGYGNYLPPESAGYADKPLQDGVVYRVVVSSKVYDMDQNAPSYVRYKLYKAAQYTNPSNPQQPFRTWTLERDTGDVLDNNVFFDKTDTGLVFGQVFDRPDAPAWSITVANITTVWKPLAAAPETEVPNWLSRSSVASALSSGPVDLFYTPTALTGSSVSITRDAQGLTGGTPGFVNSALYATTTTGTANSSFEWTLTAVMNSRSNNVGGPGAGAIPQNVAINGTARKYGNAPVWAGNFAAVDPATTYNTLTSGPLIGIEVNVALCGEDTGAATIGIDAVPQISNPGHTALAYSAYRAAGDSTSRWNYGFVDLNSRTASLYSTNTGDFGIRLAGTNIVGLSTAEATITGSAIRLAHDQYISLEATDTRKMKYNGTTGYLEFYNGTTRHGYIDITSGADVNLANGSGSSTITGLSDVAITSPSNGQTLQYNSATSKWQNSDVVTLPKGSIRSISTTITASGAVDSTSISSARVIKYTTRVSNGTNYRMSEIAIIHNGTSASMSEYGIVEMPTPLIGPIVSFSVSISQSNVVLTMSLINGTTGSTTINAIKTLITD